MAKSDKKAVKSAKTKAPTTEKKVAAPAKAKAISSTDLLAKLAPKNGKGAPSKKAPTTKDSSDSESSDSDSDSPAIPPKTANGKNGAALKKKEKPSASSSDDSSSSEDEKPKASQVKLPVAKSGSGRSSSSDDSDESDSDSDGDAPSKPQPKAKGAAPKPPPATKAESSDSSDSSSEDEKVKPPATNGTKKTLPKSVAPKPVSSPSSSEESSSESEKEAKSKGPVKSQPKPAKAGESSDSASSDSGSDSDSDSDVEMKDASAVTASANGKRKATDDSQPNKKAKLADGNAAPADSNQDGGEVKSIFVGRLSWSIDNDRLAEEFSSCGEVVSAEVQMDRNTGKSRGFGYVHFATTEAVENALKMNGQEIDGRAVNIDRSTPRTPMDRKDASNKRAKSFGDETGPPSSTLFIGNLSFSVDEDAVWNTFTDYGVKSVRLPTDRDTGRPKGFGYVEFESVDGAKKAFEELAGSEIDGRAIRLDFSQPRDGAGGGRGGGRGGFGDRGGRGGGFGGRGGFDRGGRGGGRGRGGFGDRGRGGRGGRGGGRGGNVRSGGIAQFEGKKTTF